MLRPRRAILFVSFQTTPERLLFTRALWPASSSRQVQRRELDLGLEETRQHRARKPPRLSRTVASVRLRASKGEPNHYNRMLRFHLRFLNEETPGSGARYIPRGSKTGPPRLEQSPQGNRVRESKRMGHENGLYPDARASQGTSRAVSKSQ